MYTNLEIIIKKNSYKFNRLLDNLTIDKVISNIRFYHSSIFWVFIGVGWREGIPSRQTYRIETTCRHIVHEHPPYTVQYTAYITNFVKHLFMCSKKDFYNFFQRSGKKIYLKIIIF